MNKIALISLGVSLAAHAGVMGVSARSGWMNDLKPVMPPPVEVRPDVSLEFVETPEVSKAEKADEKSKVISDKSVKAKDRTKDEAVKEKMAKARVIDKSKQRAKYAAFKKEEERIEKKVQEEKKKAEEAKPSPKKEEQKQAAPEQAEQKSPVEPLIKPVENKERKMEYDIINIPEISDSIYSSPDSGEFTIEAQEHKIGPYFKKVKKAIELYWIRYLVFRYQNSVPEPSEAVVRFKILFTGEVSDLKVLEYSGDTLFRDYCVASVTENSPFPPLPENLKEEYKKDGGLDIIFTFAYK